MQERRFNFVRRKKTIKFDFVARETRVAAGRAMPGGIKAAIRGFLITAVLLVVLGFSANKIVHFVFSAMDVKAFALNISPLAAPKYFISKGNLFMVYSNGKTKLVDKNMDGVSLPFISGVDTQEKRKGHKKALEMAVKLDKKYLGNISEINLSNPENIVMITTEGRKIYAGNSLNNEKMENYHIALDRITRRYSTVDLRFKDRVIIK